MANLSSKATVTCARLRPGLLAPLLFLSLAACRSTDGTANCQHHPVATSESMSEHEQTQQALTGVGAREFHILEKGTASGVLECLMTTIQGGERWAAFWARHSNRALPRPELPEVDFEKNCLLVLTLGSRPSAGYGLEVSAVFEELGALIVEVREIRPDPDSIQAAVVTTPYVIVSTDRFEGPVEYRLR